MLAFRKQLQQAASGAHGSQVRTWIYVAYDQLSDRIGPLAQLPANEAAILLIECPAKAARRPYHKQKLALVLANMRHFAIEQAQRGVVVRYRVARDSYAAELARQASEVGPITMMEAAERELRVELAPLVADGTLKVVPHGGWLTTAQQFAQWSGADAPWRMDSFYRGARKHLGVLMAKGKPVGGKFSFDADNRKPYRGEPAPPAALMFAPDEITREVGELVERDFADHPGTLDLTALPTTLADAAAVWQRALKQCLPTFGPYEDAMTTTSSTLFHTLISPLLNLHRLTPQQVLGDAENADIELASKEGFIRQVLGWREFVHHVHVATDGFRRGVSHRIATERDAGFARYRGKSSAAGSDGDFGIEPVVQGSKAGSTAWQPLPPAFWGEPSGLHCLDHVVAGVLQTGYSHHITRLMVLGNIATLLGVSPRELTDWFWVAYVDAYDWVVEPNVLAMATFGVGDVMTTKPYVAGSAYIHKMSNYCRNCSFDPKTTCPLTQLYWNYLDRNQPQLAGNQRMAIPLAALRKRTPEQRAAAAQTFADVTEKLQRGERLGQG